LPKVFDVAFKYVAKHFCKLNLNYGPTGLEWALALKMEKPLWTMGIYVHENMKGTDPFFKVLTCLDKIHLLLDRALNPILFDSERDTK